MAKLSTYPQRILANVAGVDASGNVGLATGSAFRGFVSAKDFGAIGDNSTDNAVALQNFFNYLTTGNANTPITGAIPPGTYLTSAKLTLNGSYFSLLPLGETEVVIRYTGGSTTSDIIVVGDATKAVQQSHIFI